MKIEYKNIIKWRSGNYLNHFWKQMYGDNEIRIRCSDNTTDLNSSCTANTNFPMSTIISCIMIQEDIVKDYIIPKNKKPQSINIVVTSRI